MPLNIFMKQFLIYSLLYEGERVLEFEQKIQLYFVL